MEPINQKPTGRENGETLPAPEIFQRPIGSEVETGIAHGLTEMWGGGSYQRDSYYVEVPGTNSAALVNREAFGETGVEPDYFEVRIQEGGLRRQVRVDVQTTRFHDPLLNLSAYDRAPRYPEEVQVGPISDERLACLADGTRVSGGFRIELSERREAIVTRNETRVVRLLSERPVENGHEVEIEWDWEGDSVVDTPNGVVITGRPVHRSLASEGNPRSEPTGETHWSKTYVSINKRGDVHYPTTHGYLDEEGNSLYEVSGLELTEEDRRTLDRELAEAGNLGKEPDQSLIALIGKKIERAQKSE